MCSSPLRRDSPPGCQAARRPHNRARSLVGRMTADATKGSRAMTAPSGPGPGQPDPGLAAIISERRQLINVAYRLLGSLAEAEDAVQETYARWYALIPAQRDAIASPGAWLSTVTSRICLDQLRSARARRERYVGQWIPEPLPEPAEWISGRPGAPADPADRITLDESVSMAFLVVLESMTPAERVAFILHDVFGHPFAEIARIVGRTPAACRQLASSCHRPPGRHHPRLQERVASQRHRRPHRPARPRRHRHGRRRRPGHRRPAPHRGRRADRAVPERPRRPRTRPGHPGTHRQRPARPDRPAQRHYRYRLRVRDRGQPHQPHLGRTQPRQTPALDHRLTRGSAGSRERGSPPPSRPGAGCRGMIGQRRGRRWPPEWR